MLIKDQHFFLFSFSDAIVHGCIFTDYENDFDGDLDYTVPDGKVLRGIDSYHENHYE